MERLNQWMTLIANIGVLAGIVFLAYEIRVNTDAVRSSTYAAYVETADSWNDFYAGHAAEIAAIEDHIRLDQLTGEQSRLYAALTNKTFNQMEATFLHHRSIPMDEDVFEARIARFKEYMEQTPLLRESWRSRRETLVGDFRDMMERNIPSLKPPTPS